MFGTYRPMKKDGQIFTILDNIYFLNHLHDGLYKNIALKQKMLRNLFYSLERLVNNLESNFLIPYIVFQIIGKNKIINNFSLLGRYSVDKVISLNQGWSNFFCNEPS